VQWTVHTKAKTLPYRNTWFFLGPHGRDGLRVGARLRRRFLDEEVTIHRDVDGLRATSGWGRRSRTWVVEETWLGLHIACAEDGRQVEVPLPDVERHGWMEPVRYQFTIPVDVKVAMGNAVDRDHYEPIHGFVVESLSAQIALGGVFESRIAGRQTVAGLRLPKNPFWNGDLRIAFTSTWRDLGFMDTRIHLLDLGVEVNALTGYIPVADGMTLHLLVRVRRHDSFLTSTAAHLVNRVKRRLLALGTRQNVAADCRYWCEATRANPDIVKDGYPHHPLFNDWYRQFEPAPPDDRG
jgi:hypothetical protein